MGETWPGEVASIFIGRLRLNISRGFIARSWRPSSDHNRHRAVIIDRDHDVSEEDTRMPFDSLDAAIAIGRWTLHQAVDRHRTVDARDVAPDRGAV